MRRAPAKYVTLVTQMRCPSCGTENATDSRFCGGCGTRLGTTAARVAPTQKIPDDASFPQPAAPAHAGPAAAMPAVPRIAQPGRHPPSGLRPVIAPPRAASVPGLPPPGAAPPRRITGPIAVAPADPVAGNAAHRPPAPTPAPYPHAPPSAPASASSLAIPIAARRPWRLIAVVLVIDLGLAAAGAWLLSRGLARPEPRRAAPRSSSVGAGAGPADSSHSTRASDPARASGSARSARSPSSSSSPGPQ
jgi:hypothetical protein